MNDVKKIAIVGLGYWGPNLLRNLVAAVGADRVVAVDRSVERMAAVCAHYPTVDCAGSLDQALGEHDLAAVVVATPVTKHAELALMALEAGCHVLVEKPLASSSAEAAEIVATAARRERVLMVGHTFLFSPRIERIREYLLGGKLGDIQYVTSSRLNLGHYQQDVSVIWDLAPHDLSILFHLLGELPETVQTSGRSVVRTGTLDVAFMNFTFPSGVVASVTVSWLAPRKVRNTVVVGDLQMLIFDDIDNEEPIKIYDTGVVVPDPNNFGEHQLSYRHGDVLSPHVPAREPLAQELAHFLACINGNQVCASDGRFGLRVVEALEAAERSWYLGGMPVTVDMAEVEPTRATA